MDTYQPIRELIDGVRARWRLLRLFRSAARGAAGASAVLAAGLVAAQWADRSPLALIAIVGGVGRAGGRRAGVGARRRSVSAPSDRRVARFIEERAPALDDRLVTAVDLVESGAAARPGAGAVLAGPMLADAAARAQQVDLDAVFPSTSAEARRLARGGRDARAAAGRVLLCGPGAAVAGRRLAAAVSFARRA